MDTLGCVPVTVKPVWVYESPNENQVFTAAVPEVTEAELVLEVLEVLEEELVLEEVLEAFVLLAEGDVVT